MTTPPADPQLQPEPSAADYVNVIEAAELLGVPLAMALTMCTDGRMPTVAADGVLRMRRADLLAWREQRRQQQYGTTTPRTAPAAGVGPARPPGSRPPEDAPPQDRPVPPAGQGSAPADRQRDPAARSTGGAIARGD